jgi:hypothetical protein
MTLYEQDPAIECHQRAAVDADMSASAKTGVLNQTGCAVSAGHIFQNPEPDSLARMVLVDPSGLRQERFDFGNGHGAMLNTVGILHAVAVKIPGSLISPFFAVSCRHLALLIFPDLVLYRCARAHYAGSGCWAGTNFFRHKNVKMNIIEVVCAHTGTVDHEIGGRSDRAETSLCRSGKRGSGSLAVSLKPGEDHVFRWIDYHGGGSQGMPHAISTICDRRSQRNATPPVSSAVSARSPPTPPPPLLFPHLNFSLHHTAHHSGVPQGEDT